MKEISNREIHEHYERLRNESCEHIQELYYMIDRLLELIEKLEREKTMHYNEDGKYKIIGCQIGKIEEEESTKIELAKETIELIEKLKQEKHD